MDWRKYRMNKPCYSDYVRHAMRFYSRYPNTRRFKSKVEESNWKACCKVLQTYTKEDREVLTYVYGEFDTLGDNVYAIANKLHIHQNIIWDMMKDFEREVAIERGLWV